MKVEWHHELPDEPVVLYSEIDAGREVRKVEVYRDGRMGFADSARATGTTVLGQGLIPTVEEIAEQDEFGPSWIDGEEFEEAWRLAQDRG